MCVSLGLGSEVDSVPTTLPDGVFSKKESLDSVICNETSINGHDIHRIM